MRTGDVGRRVAGLLLAAGVAALLSAPGTAIADPAPVVTESFEAGSFEAGSGLPGGWRFVEYQAAVSTATIVGGAGADGTHFLRIASTAPNHARVVLPVPLAPSTTYRFHAVARATGVGAGAAAVLGVDGQYTVTDSARTSVWQELALYVTSGTATSVDLTLGLGHFGQLNAGAADFDAVTVTAVDAAPAGAVVAELAPAAAAAPEPRAAADLPEPRGPSALLWAFVGVLAVVGAGAVVVLRCGDRRERAGRHGE